MPNWKQKDGKTLLPSAVDIQNCCGYITLLSLDDSDDGFFDGVVQTGNGNNLPRNGEMNEENLDLLMEEVDNIPDTSMMGAKPKNFGPPTPPRGDMNFVIFGFQGGSKMEKNSPGHMH